MSSFRVLNSPSGMGGPNHLCKAVAVRGLAWVFLLPLAGCVHFVAPYDATLDTTMTQVQHDTELLFSQLQEAPAAEATYDARKDFYVKTEATLRTLLVRAQAVHKNHEVADQVAQIESSIERIQAQHKRDGTLPQAALNVDRGLLESEFRSFFTLELALKTHFASQPGSAMAPAMPPP